MRCVHSCRAVVAASLFILVFVSLAIPALAEVKPAMVFSDHMVLQRNRPIRVWGQSIIAAWMTDTVKTDWPELPGGRPVTGNLQTLVGNLYLYKVKKAAPLNIGGIVWSQGWNDVIKGGARAEYEANLTAFIKDMRNDLGTPNTPFIVGELGQGGPEAVGPVAQFRTAQKNVVKAAGHAA